MVPQGICLAMLRLSGLEHAAAQRTATASVARVTWTGEPQQFSIRAACFSTCRCCEGRPCNQCKQHSKRQFQESEELEEFFEPQLMLSQALRFAGLEVLMRILGGDPVLRSGMAETVLAEMLEKMRVRLDPSPSHHLPPMFTPLGRPMMHARC